jgi:hypothetical protein
MKRLTRLPVHPFLLVGYFFAFLYGNNLGRITVATLSLPFALALGIVAALYFVLFRAARDIHRAALVTSVLVILFFTYGQAYGLLYVRAPTVTPLMLHLILTELFLALLLLAHIWFRRLKDLTQATFGAHVMGGLLVLMALTPILASAAQTGKDRPSPERSAVALGADTAPHKAPDVFLIVLDGYGRQDILKERYGFANEAMVDSLNALGFQVSQHSRSNYAWTHLSLASLLNMRYLDDLALRRHDGEISTASTAHLIRENEVVRFFRSRGYRYIHFNSTWGATHTNPFADDEVRCSGTLFEAEAYRAIIESSWLRVLDFAVASDLAKCHLSQFEQLAEAATRQSPKFVFAHFIPPHHPYLFDREGRVLRRATIANQMQFQENLWADRDGYLEQLRFVNDRVLHVVGRILAESEEAPIIVLLSDHGPQLPGTDRYTFLNARFANFSAFHLPGNIDNAGGIPDDITAVNVFRTVLTQHFGLKLPMLDDRQFYSTYEKPYRFIDITDEITPAVASRFHEGELP